MVGGMVHVLLVSFTGHGHVNPMLRLAKCLASKGLLVTFSAPHDVGYKIIKSADNITKTTTIGLGQLRFEFFSDGWGISDPRRHDIEALLSQIAEVGPRALTNLIDKQANEGRPVSYIVNNPFMPWVRVVAINMGIPSALLWSQSCALFSICYHYFHGLATFPTEEQPTVSVQLPGLPLLLADELPTYLLPSNPFPAVEDAILANFKTLKRVSWVLVDSYEELECHTVTAMSQNFLIKPIGPLIKSVNQADHEVRDDMPKATYCLEWLDAQPPSSVVYISFGSIVVLGKEQMEEIAWGVKKSGRPFLWIVRGKNNSTETGLPIGFTEEMGDRGLVLKWCPQEEVLSHPSIACFVTHCGWNSTMETVTFGVPIIAFPHFGDQKSNAKFLADVFKVGVRMCAGQNRLASSDEVQKCIDEVTKGAKAEEMRKNALEWKQKAGEAAAEGGSSDRNIEAFVDEVRSRASKNLPAMSQGLVSLQTMSHVVSAVQ